MDAVLTEFFCNFCQQKICSEVDFVASYPPIPFCLSGGMLFTNAMPSSIITSACSSQLDYVSCQNCLSKIGFKFANIQGYPSYIHVDMLYFDIEKLTPYAVVPIDDFLLPNLLMCKNCSNVIAEESSIQNDHMMKNYSTNCVALNLLRNCILSWNEPMVGDILNFRGDVCCAKCNTFLGWQRVKSYEDGTLIGEGLSHLLLDKLWFRYFNIMVPANRMIAPSIV